MRALRLSLLAQGRSLSGGDMGNGLIAAAIVLLQDILVEDVGTAVHRVLLVAGRHRGPRAVKHVGKTLRIGEGKNRDQNGYVPLGSSCSHACMKSGNHVYGI